MSEPSRIAIVMGVSGSGKTTVAALVAHIQGWAFVEGDDLHPPENVAKMAAGTPLTDEDRWPWLRAIAGRDRYMAAQPARPGVVTCSALRVAYRALIIGDRPDVSLVYLRGDRSLIASRMAARHEHFMPLALLDSQFATLEEPIAAEHPIIVPIDGTPLDQQRR